ncbi:MAG: VWA domain-containing protein, partial [Anaerolineae bacterium]
MSFTNPLALLGLLTIPLFIWLGRPKGWGRGRRITAIVLRVLIVVCVVLGLSGLQVVRATDDLAVVFVIDASDSMPPQTIDAARDYANDAIARMRPDDQAAVIVFGSDALVERPMTPAREIGPLESEVLSLNTDLSEAIRLAMALYPPGSARRMVILSDGLANVGDAEEAARLAAASGVEIVAVPFSALSGQEILVTDVDVPTTLNIGQTFDITVAVESNLQTTAILRIIGGGQVVVEETVALVEGVNRYAFTLTATEAGLTAFRVQIVPAAGEEDVFLQNNELAAFTQVVGPPRVLLVADDAVEIANLAPALLAQGLEVDQTTGSGLPPDLAVLGGYDAVVLANVPARSLGPTRMEALQTYVRDLGGGLVVIGGPNAYEAGGY